MVYKIIWTEDVLNQLEKVVEYLSEEWSIDIAEDFIIDFYMTVELIKIFPQTGIVSGKYGNVRRRLVTRHNALYYEVGESTITLLELFDTRQDPERNVFE